MKILELEIRNVRGIKKLSINPNGSNVVIHGPNGSGKSAVVDAIDFLFTGNISRLTGRGTKDISLKEHGPHIDANPEDAVVIAKIEMDDDKQPVTLVRKMSDPKNVLSDSESEDVVARILDAAQKGQYVLSRAEILKYIAIESGKRAEEIQAILDLGMAEQLRKTFVTIEREMKRKFDETKRNIEDAIRDLKSSLSIEEFREEYVLNKVNHFRGVLKGKPIESLETANLRIDIKPPTGFDGESVDPEVLGRYLVEVNKWVVEKGPETFHKEAELRALLKQINENAELKRGLAQRELVRLGIDLVDETGACPLCLREWEPEELKTFLRSRLKTIQIGEKIEREINKYASEITVNIDTLLHLLKQLADFCQKLKQDVIYDTLLEWFKRLQGWRNALTQIKQYPCDAPNESFGSFLQPKVWDEHVKKLEELRDGLEKMSPEQKAWDSLTRLEPLLVRYFREKEKFLKAKDIAVKAKILERVYTRTKDKVLEGLYKSVNQDFVDYYKTLHGEDEKGFDAELKPQGSELDFKVDFYGRGYHHPRALHSEGHQDSMGLCLYLALNKKISEGKVKFIILDDVVMSIDSGHRRNICKLLKQYFPDHQFFITTHNRTWARQLRTFGIADKNGLIEFRGWSVETGPKCVGNYDVWESIKKKLDNDDIPGAAHELRNYGEFFYEQVCDALQGKIVYRSDGRWTFGDWVQVAISAYKRLLKKAMNSAQKWGDMKKLEELRVLDSVRKEVVSRCQIEQWAINANVHYSKWDDFTKEDFLPIVEAFRDLEGLFICSRCGGVINVVAKENKPSAVKCHCGKFFWNLS